MGSASDDFDLGGRAQAKGLAAAQNPSNRQTSKGGRFEEAGFFEDSASRDSARDEQRKRSARRTWVTVW